MSGEAELYKLARVVLLDALDALGEHRAAVVLVGAQAIYLHVGDADLAVPPHTTDGDLVLDPGRLAGSPPIAAALERAGFTQDVERVGTWRTVGHLGRRTVNVEVDFMVPEAVGGPGRRGARLGAHGKRLARKTRGLEGTLVDNTTMSIASFEPKEDARSFEIRVAGPAALLVAKLHKIGERQAEPARLQDKDALDVLRLLRGCSTETLMLGVGRMVGDGSATPVAAEAREILSVVFGRASAVGAMMAGRAARGAEPEDVIRQSVATLAQDLLAAWKA